MAMSLVCVVNSEDTCLIGTCLFILVFIISLLRICYVEGTDLGDTKHKFLKLGTFGKYLEVRLGR